MTTSLLGVLSDGGKKIADQSRQIIMDFLLPYNYKDFPQIGLKQHL